ncbi:MAG: PH domain-containing protein [Candidatus Micrarchaeota archaeon]
MPAYDTADTPTSKQVPLHPNKILKKTISGSASALLVLLFVSFMIIAVTASAIGLSVALGVAIVILVGAVAIEYIYQTWYYRAYYYDIKTEILVIRKGVFAPKEISVPFARIQDVYVDRDLLDLAFGLYDVHISTATEQSGVHAHIDGVDEGNAQKLKEMIIARVKKESKKKNEGL